MWPRLGGRSQSGICPATSGPRNMQEASRQSLRFDIQLTPSAVPAAARAVTETVKPQLPLSLDMGLGPPGLNMDSLSH